MAGPRKIYRGVHICVLIISIQAVWMKAWRNKLLGGVKRKLKNDAVPTIFAYKPAPKVRASRVMGPAKRKCQEVRRKFALLCLN